GYRGELQAALAESRGRRGQPTEVGAWLARLLAGMPPSRRLTARDRDLVRSRRHEMTPTVFETSLPTQPIHGDASVSNLLRTTRGLLWNDLEDVCSGPVHWDVAGLVIEARATGESENFVEDFLDAYGAVE